MVEPMLCHARNPWRVPDWKWQRAIQIVDEQAPPPTRARDGEFPMVTIRKLVRYYREWSRIATLPPLQARQAEARLQDDWFDIYWAHGLYRSPGVVSARWAIEARILASQSDVQIAASNRCATEMVQLYADVFFDVRGNLDRPEFILHSVFGDALYRGLNDQDYGTLWKLLGYFGGASVVDCLTHRLMTRGRSKRDGGVAGFFQGLAIDSVKMKAAIAAITAPINGQTRLPLIDAFADYLEIERTMQTASNESSQIMGNVKEMLDGLRASFSVGSRLGVLKTSKMGEDMERGAAELSTSEMMRLANGMPVPEIDEIRNLKFPDPVS